MLERCFGPKRAQLAPGVQEGFLGHVLDVWPITEKSAGQAKHASLVQPHQIGVRIRIASQRRGDESILVALGRRGPF